MLLLMQFNRADIQINRAQGWQMKISRKSQEQC